jgi:hypothetical protein
VGLWPRLRGIIKTDIRDKTPSFSGGVLCDLPAIGEDRVVSYLQVGERESERSTLITDRRESNERSKYI